MPIRNADQVRKELARMRKDALKNRGATQGYKNEGGQAVQQPGDDDSPFVKLPPFPDKTTLEYLAADFTGGIVIGSPIELAKARALTLWVEYAPAANANAPQIGIVGAALRPGQEQDPLGPNLYPLSVLDAALTPLVPPVAAQRTFYQSELVSDVLVGGTVFRFLLPFEVSNLRTVLFQVREIQEAAPGDPGLVGLGITYST